MSSRSNFREMLANWSHRVKIRVPSRPGAEKTAKQVQGLHTKGHPDDLMSPDQDQMIL